MAGKNRKNGNIRRPATNYEDRAKAVVTKVLVHVKAMVSPGAWKAPTRKQIDVMARNLHLLLNWAFQEQRMAGLTTPFYPGPLTEEEMRGVERRLRRIRRIHRFDGGAIVEMLANDQ